MAIKNDTQIRQLNSAEMREYASATAGPIYYLPLDPGFLEISGPDRSTFLQRQTTNDLNLLSPGRALVTILTSPAARILDVLTLLLISRDDREQVLGIITLPGRAEQTDIYLRERIFFMDKVSLVNASKEFSQIEISGPGIQSILQSLGVSKKPAPDEMQTVNTGGASLTLIGLRGLSGPDYRILVPRGEQADLLDRVERLGAVRISEPVHEILRLEAGLPGPAMELTGEFTPLETGLGFAISDQKGCYTGQEVIARQVTYDKVTQHLAGIRVSAPVSPGETIWIGEKKAGITTSAVISPRFGPIALGMIRRPHHNPGTEIVIGEQDAPVTGQVVEIPFS